MIHEERVFFIVSTLRHGDYDPPVFLLETASRRREGAWRAAWYSQRRNGETMLTCQERLLASGFVIAEAAVRGEVGS